MKKVWTPCRPSSKISFFSNVDYLILIRTLTLSWYEGNAGSNSTRCIFSYEFFFFFKCQFFSIFLKWISIALINRVLDIKDLLVMLVSCLAHLVAMNMFNEWRSLYKLKEVGCFQDWKLLGSSPEWWNQFSWHLESSKFLEKF